MTFIVNDYYYVSVRSGKQTGPRDWQAQANVFRRDNNNKVGDDFFGNGSTHNTARDRAGDNAEKFALMQSIPTDWEK